MAENSLKAGPIHVDRQAGSVLFGLVLLAIIWCAVFVLVGFAGGIAWWMIQAGWEIVW